MRFNFLSVHFRKEVHRSENKKHFSRDTPSNRTTERATCDLRLDQRRPSIRSQRRDRSRKCGVQNVRFTKWSITSSEVAKSGISYVIIITILKTNAYHSFYVTDPYSSSLSVSLFSDSASAVLLSSASAPSLFKHASTAFFLASSHTSFFPL